MAQSYTPRPITTRVWFALDPSVLSLKPDLTEIERRTIRKMCCGLAVLHSRDKKVSEAVKGVARGIVRDAYERSYPGIYRHQVLKAADLESVRQYLTEQWSLKHINVPQGLWKYARTARRVFDSVELWGSTKAGEAMLIGTKGHYRVMLARLILNKPEAPKLEDIPQVVKLKRRSDFELVAAAGLGATAGFVLFVLGFVLGNTQLLESYGHFLSDLRLLMAEVGLCALLGFGMGKTLAKNARMRLTYEFHALPARS